MLFLDLLHQLKEFSFIDNVGLDDIIDRINHKLTVIFFILFTSFVTVRQYFLSPISCYVSHEIGGANAREYLQNMCWTEGLYPINFSQTIRQHDKDWDDLSNQQFHYYQWVPMVLALQAIVYWLPNVIWQVVNTLISGVDFSAFIGDARRAHLLIKDSRQRYVRLLAYRLYHVLDTKRSMKRRYLFLSYLVLKLVYVVVNVGQLLVIYFFLGFDKKENYFEFGERLAANLWHGRTWEDTLIFPRVGMCRHAYEVLGATNYMFAQCALPINMINEKIFIFLYFYIVSTLFLSICGFLNWFIAFGMCDSFKAVLAKKISAEFNMKALHFDGFYLRFLRLDGCLLMKMLMDNVGSMMSEEIINCLFDEYVRKENEARLVRC